ncbi:hypothetical protein E5Q_01838, partial [Mixia osmundae IAM 14324]
SGLADDDYEPRFATVPADEERRDLFAPVDQALWHAFCAAAVERWI